jgi:hypothetical protein
MSQEPQLYGSPLVAYRESFGIGYANNTRASESESMLERNWRTASTKVLVGFVEKILYICKSLGLYQQVVTHPTVAQGANAE